MSIDIIQFFNRNRKELRTINRDSETIKHTNIHINVVPETEKRRK